MSDVDTIENACRLWWECPDKTGKRMATIPWDETPAAMKEMYQRRMANALGLLNSLTGTPNV